MNQLDERFLILGQMFHIGTGLLSPLAKEVDGIGIVEGAQAVERLALEMKASLACDQESSIGSLVQPAPYGRAG